MKIKLISASIIIMIFGSFIFVKYSTFFKIDKCLDSGGSWNYQTNECKNSNDIEAWKLGWRMIENAWDKENEIASLQFDSLLKTKSQIKTEFLMVGLEVKIDLGKNEEVEKILLNNKRDEVLSSICKGKNFQDMEICNGFKKEQVQNINLQIELIKMYINDQAVRNNIMKDIIAKYNIDTSQLISEDGFLVDKKNRTRLKEIIEEYDFPTKKLVGKDAMSGIFIMIQHSDEDKEWQKSQLKNIQEAVKKGDMNGQSYAYLFDRIKINEGSPQYYGTQFSKVDPANKIVELFETEDIENLNRRRMEIGMMPIENYKKMMLEMH